MEFFKDLSAFYIEQIGVAVKELSAETRARHPEIRWGGIVGMRNIIAHGYDSYNPEIWWISITEEVPVLKGVCEYILKEITT